VAEVRAAACYAAEKFDIVEVTTFLSDLLNDGSAEVRKAAIALAMKLKPDKHSEEVLQLLHSKDIDVAERAFFRLTEEKKLTRDILLQLVQSSPHGGLRYLAAHAVDWKTEDESLLIRLFQDEHPQVRFYAVLGLRKIRSRSSLDAVIELLGHETDSNTIGSILRMLGEVHGEKNSDVLLEWTQTPDDFQRLCAFDSLCKLGDMRVEPVAQLLLGETRSPTRSDEYGLPFTSHVKSIATLATESLRSSPNRDLRRLGSKSVWPKWLTFKRSSE
jgi:HEAT repeat protein